MNVRIQNFFDRIVYINSADVNNVINRLLAPVKDISQNAPELLETIAVNVYGFGRITIQFIMAIFIAFYMLLDKERFSLKAKKRDLHLLSQGKGRCYPALCYSHASYLPEFHCRQGS